ncbi:MAG: ATP-dependent DNA helicase RecG [Pseudomonadota bacterium]|nr:ATP-dependent DNA helicase RecG [Pseudomonadota bacterium]
MRPKTLFRLFTRVTSLPGVGPKTGRLLQHLAGENIVDLLWHLPTGLIDRRHAPRIAEAAEGTIGTLTLTVDKHFPSPRRGLPYRVRCIDETGVLTLVFFNGREDYLQKLMPVGEIRVISGRIEKYNEKIQITHPDHVGTIEELKSIKVVEPVYSLTSGLTSKPLNRAINGAIELAPDLPEWQEPNWLKQQKWESWQLALRNVHHPQSETDLSPDSPSRKRLAYDELLANQLALLIVRERQRSRSGRSISGNGTLQERLKSVLPFALTGSQQAAITEILADMKSELRMLRLLQGDVGSGKTIVALMAMLIAVEEGEQTALMAPTELLARQHFETIQKLAPEVGFDVLLITGRDKGKRRKQLLEHLSSGKAVIAIGTHALFQDDVNFQNLALIVVDEQHRFGVHQRLALSAKGESTDILVMTATPIPRTLMMTAYGDMETSRLTEKPAGRQPIETRVMPQAKVEEIVDRMRHAIAIGARIYWVCPLVEDSDTLDITAAIERHATLSQSFGERVGLIHGRLKPTQKDAVMEKFITGELDILVATTVIEVGVDVPEATIIVIEQAERFGLAQLHQLRGRVGRAREKSACILMYGEPLTQAAAARLKVIRETEDGFAIADQDLLLRGAGEVLGTRQSGLPQFKIADPIADADLIAVARDDAKLFLERDPTLKSERGKALKTLLYLFERDAVVKTALSG